SDSSCMMPVIVMVTGTPPEAVTPMTATCTNPRFGGESRSGTANAAVQSGAPGFGSVTLVVVVDEVVVVVVVVVGGRVVVVVVGGRVVVVVVGGRVVVVGGRVVVVGGRVVVVVVGA